MSNRFRISARMERVQPSVTLAVSAKAKKLKAEGVDIISFGAGEPDFDTPDHIKDAARRGLDEGVAKYTVVPGIVPLRKAIAVEMERVHGIPFGLDQIIVSAGAKQSLYNLFMSLLDDGDEVIVPAPYWVSYPEIVKLAGGTPVIVASGIDDGFVMRPESFAAAITDKTRAVILNTPSNPSGAVYSRETLEGIAQVAVERDIVVVTDDIYRSLVYGDATYTSIATLGSEIAERCILIDGVSKTYAMTGWRIGWTAGPKEVVAAMVKLQGQNSGGPTRIAQVAACQALEGPQDCVTEMHRAFDERRQLIVKKLRAIPNVDCRTPDGAFYAFPSVQAFIGKKTSDGSVIEDDVGLCNYLIERGRVAVVPGSAFGAPGFIRMSYACSNDDIRNGTDRLGEALGALL